MPDPPIEVPPLPRFEPAKVAAWRERIVEDVGFPYYGETLEGARLGGFAADLAEALRRAGVPRGVAAKSCVLLAGRALTPAVLADFAWRVAGNLDSLRRGDPLAPHGPPPAPEWAPFVVLSALPGLDRRGRYGVELGVRAVAGRYCPAKSSVFWRREVYTALARTFGFGRRGRPRALQNAAQLVGLRVFGLLEPERCDGRPSFRKVAASPAMVAHNRAVLARRFRSPSGRDCPFGLDGAAYVPCHRCGVGYAGADGVDACRAACRRRALEPRPCPACGAPAAPFDLDASEAKCLACLVRERTKPTR